MDIKIGFTESPRELIIKLEEAAREDAVTRIKEALKADEGILELDDAKGRTYLINAEEVAYVEVGADAAHPVGFMGA
jgi:hypothetical protein